VNRFNPPPRLSGGESVSPGSVAEDAAVSIRPPV